MKICRECFYEVFEEEIHQVIVQNQLFKPGERIAIGASGGKGECFLSYCILSTSSETLLVFLLDVPSVGSQEKTLGLLCIKRSKCLGIILVAIRID